MASRYEVEVTASSARDLKNVNWRNGELKPYAVLWIDDGPKCSTRVDLDNGENPAWDEKVTVPLPPRSARLDDAVLYLDVVHANAGEGVKSPLVGSARLPLRDVLDDAGIGGKASRTLRLKRPSGRPQGKVELRVSVKEPARYYDPNPYPAPGSAYPSRDPYAAGGAYGGAAAAGYGTGAYGSGGGGYGAAQPYAVAAPPSGYPAAYGAAPPPAQPAAYGGYGAAPPPAQPAAYGGYGAAAAPPAAGVVDPGKQKKGSKMGVGTGVAVGAAAGLLGGLALAGGASYLEDKFEDHVAEKVEENLERQDSYGCGYDDYCGDDY